MIPNINAHKCYSKLKWTFLGILLILSKHYINDEVTPGPWSGIFFCLTGTKSAAIRTLVTQNSCVKEFLHLCSENCISWIFGIFFENVHEWKTYRCNYPGTNLIWSEILDRIIHLKFSFSETATKMWCNRPQGFDVTK